MTQDEPITDPLDVFLTERRGVITLLPKVTNLMDLPLELLAAKEVSKGTRPRQKHRGEVERESGSSPDPWKHSSSSQVPKPIDLFFIWSELGFCHLQIKEF